MQAASARPAVNQQLTTFAPDSHRDKVAQTQKAIDKAPSNWRRSREPNFQKIGHDHRAASEQARQFIDRNAGQNKTRNAQVS